ncbi:hypothetical protein [Methylovulum psychrotolerans]|uniref:Uncharacterized protein n=1 Tax=Methylovulum psychrotolerans TaxID=1704499 RepID=A0A2S5CIJ7_9GAMM|nr:hypothetical protein [Methylovulum psychrotolerans]POZ50625.1 hypothetical protein AADEFJLK_03518 [Methylovulum psychrotolerans]
MGYTHNFQITRRPTQENWAHLMFDVEHLIKTLPSYHELINLGSDVDKGIVLRGPMGDKKPICNSRKIAFNGDSLTDSACETFLLAPKVMADSCKTARQPYDFVVCASLVLGFLHIPDFVLTSDGDTDDWLPAVSWVRQNINPAAVMPSAIKEVKSNVTAEPPPKSAATQTLSVYFTTMPLSVPDAYF